MMVLYTSSLPENLSSKDIVSEKHLQGRGIISSALYLTHHLFNNSIA